MRDLYFSILRHVRDVSMNTATQEGVRGMVLFRCLRILFIPLSWLYAVGVWCRHMFFCLGVFKVRGLPCAVISVGNIVVGGTGKTPAVIAIAKQLQAAGVRVGILLRGYKRIKRERVTIVSDGEKLCCSAAESGDEAHMIARCLRGIPVIVGKRRYLAGFVAVKRFDVEVLLLDDGFQHRQLARDVEILTVNAMQPYGTGRLLPAGTLREPRAAFQRADILLLTHTDTPDINELRLKMPRRSCGSNRVSPFVFSAVGVEGLATLKQALKRLAPKALILESVHQPTHLYGLGGACSCVGGKVGCAVATQERGILPVSRLRGKRLLAVCGIAMPEAFVMTLMRCCPKTVDLLAFGDHHVYTEADLEQIQSTFWGVGAELVVTTQKDEQKLAGFAAQVPIVVLAVALVVSNGNDTLADVLLPACGF